MSVLGKWGKYKKNGCDGLSQDAEGNIALHPCF